MKHKYQPISPQDLSKFGRGGDNIVAHINEEEARLLKARGGSGTINPHTGLPEFMVADTHYSYAFDGGGGDFGDFGGFDFGGDFGGYDYGGDYGGGGATDFSGSQILAPIDSGSTSPFEGSILVGPNDVAYGDTTPSDIPAYTPVDVGNGSIMPSGGNDFYIPQDVIYGDTTPSDIPAYTPVDVGNGYIMPSNDYYDYVAPVDTYTAPVGDNYYNLDGSWDFRGEGDFMGGGIDAGTSTGTGGYQGGTDYTVGVGGFDNNVVGGGNITDTTGLDTGPVIPTSTGPASFDYTTDTSGGYTSGGVTNLTGAVSPTDISTGVTDTTNLVQVGDNQYLDTTTGGIVDSSGTVLLAPIVPGPGTDYAAANIDTGVVTDAGTGAIDLSGTGGITVDVSGFPITSDQLAASTVNVPAGYTIASSQDANNTTIRYDENDNRIFDGPAQLMTIDGKDVWVKPDLSAYTPFNATANTYGAFGETANTAGTIGAVNPSDINISNVDFSGSTTNLSGTSGANNVNLSNVVLGDANVAGVSGGSNANVTLDNVTGGNVTGTSGTISPGTGNISITNSTYGNISNIATTTDTLNVINSINDSISNATSNLTNANIANTFSNTINNVLSNMSNVNISNANVGNISNSVANIANANITDTQANNISNVISIMTNSNIANANAGSIFNAVSNIANSNISNTTVRDVSNVISNISNSNISNTIANSITNSVSNLANVKISNSTANLIQNVSSNLSNVIVANSSSNIANLITSTSNGNANIGTITITANTLANANVVANVLSNVISNSNTNSNVISNIITNSNVISNVLTNANVISNVLTNANVLSNVLTNANVISNVLTNANVITNVISNVSNVTSNVANVPRVGNVNLGYLNPGFIRPTDFYNTTNDVQGRFYWGSHPFQPGPTFNETLYNTVPNAPETPFGLQQIAKPLTGAQINDIIMGKTVIPNSTGPATRKVPITEANKNVMNTDYSKVGQLPVVTAPVAPNTTVASTSTDAQSKLLAEKLGANWFNKQQAAAAAGDWETYNLIQQQVNAILNPVIEQF